MKRISTKDFIENFPTECKNEETYFNIVEENCILQGEFAIPKTNWVVYKSHRFGGTIVNFKDDICIANFKKGYFIYGEEILALLGNYLQSKGLNVSIDCNDLIVDGVYKVASYASTNIDGIIYTAIHISMSVDLEIINLVCSKPTNKIPKGLNDYNITTKEIEHFIINNIDSIL